MKITVLQKYLRSYAGEGEGSAILDDDQPFHVGKVRCGRGSKWKSLSVFSVTWERCVVHFFTQRSCINKKRERESDVRMKLSPDSRWVGCERQQRIVISSAVKTEAEFLRWLSCRGLSMRSLFHYLIWSRWRIIFYDLRIRHRFLRLLFGIHCHLVYVNLWDQVWR